MEIGSPFSASRVRESPMSCSSVISCGLEPAGIGSTASFRLGGPRRNSFGMGSFTTAYLFDNDSTMRGRFAQFTVYSRALLAKWQEYFVHCAFWSTPDRSELLFGPQIAPLAYR